MEVGKVQPFLGLSVPSEIRPQTPEEKIAQREVVQAIKAVNQAQVFGENNELTFSFDRSTGRPITKLVDRKTKEVVRQIPNQTVLELARDLKTRYGADSYA